MINILIRSTGEEFPVILLSAVMALKLFYQRLVNCSISFADATITFFTATRVLQIYYPGVIGVSPHKNYAHALGIYLVLVARTFL